MQSLLVWSESSCASLFPTAPEALNKLRNKWVSGDTAIGSMLNVLSLWNLQTGKDTLFME